MNIDFSKKPATRIVKTLQPVKRQTPAATYPVSRPSLPKPASKLANGRQNTSSTSAAGRRSAYSPMLTPASSTSPTRKRTLTMKRKAPTPSTPMSSDSEGSDNEGSIDGPLTPRKRVRTSRSLEPDLRRRIRFTADETAEDRNPSFRKFLHGADLIQSDHWKDDAVMGFDLARDFKTAFERNEGIPLVELQYPSKSPPERFALVHARESEGYKPLEDIINTVEAICQYYFPDDAETLMDESNGYPRRLKRAVQQQSLDDFKKVLDDFNKMVRAGVHSGKTDKALDEMGSMPLSLTTRIIDQTYNRTVSPRVASLRRYEAGSNNVYGELLIPFVHRLFRETDLKSHHVFVDLGSGVGNVVIQAALEVGCESWGIEVMQNPSRAAKLQRREIIPRATRLWNINLGKINILADDFLENQQIGAVLHRADVIIVNNKAFSPQLNGALLDKFLDLKEGAKIVSLKPFVDPHHEIKSFNVNDRVNLFTCVEKEYFSNCVSWTNEGGNYYIQTKDRSRLDKFLESQKRGRRG